jgi:catechol 2,3-dioxygenase-like lactoylglutathione lyase family enzyme
MIIGIAHVNLTVPPGTLEQAAEFYGNTLGFTRVAVPVLQKDTLAWYVLFPFLPASFTLSCPASSPHSSLQTLSSPRYPSSQTHPLSSKNGKGIRLTENKVRHHPKRPTNPHLLQLCCSQ